MNSFADAVTKWVGGEVVGIYAERVFYFFGDEFETRQNIKNKYDEWDDEVMQRKHVANWHGDAIEKDEFFEKGAI